MSFAFDPYQIEAVRFLAVRRRALIKAPAGSGKTIIASGALAAVVGRKERVRAVRVGWLANTVEQCQQAFKALVLIYSGEVCELAEAEARWVEVVRLRRLQLDVKIRCAASNEDWSDRDVLVVDEAHHATAPLWFDQIRTCPNALWGFTATPDNERDDGRNVSLVNLFGGEVHVVPREAVKSRIAPAKVVMLDAFDAGLPERMNEMISAEHKRRMRFTRQDSGVVFSQVAWGVVAEFGIAGNKRRSDAAVAVANRHARDHVIMLVNNIEHGERLAARVPNSRLCFSKMGAKRRREALESFRRGETRCLVATSLADEGLDLPMANVLVLVSGGRSRAKAEQRTGRVLRNWSGKTHGLIYDFRDSAHGLMAKHAEARVSLYRSLGYELVGELNLNAR